MSSQQISRTVARRIINSVSESGTPPEYGFQYFTAGIEDYISVIDEEYLDDFIADGGSSFKMVVGTYGGGKTHFLYSVREAAWNRNFAVSYFPLSPEETPFHNLERVYSAIANNLMRPMTEQEILSGYERGVESMVRSWYASKRSELENAGFSGNDLDFELREYASTVRGFDNTSFGRAMQSAFTLLHSRRDDDFDTVLEWIKGEAFDRRDHRPFGIHQRIDRSSAFAMIRSLIQWVKFIGYSGLVVLMDEAERVPSLSSRQRELLLNNLRALIDECGHANFQHAFILYAVPDEDFLEGRAQIYEALRQRLETLFEEFNPTGVKIILENTGGDPISNLRDIGRKLADIYQISSRVQLDQTQIESAVAMIAPAAYEERFGEIGYKRLFVQRMVRGLRVLHRRGGPITLSDAGFDD